LEEPEKGDERNWFSNVRTIYSGQFQNSFKRIEPLYFSERNAHKWDAHSETMLDAVPTPRRLNLLSPYNGQPQKNLQALSRVLQPRSSSPRGPLMERSTTFRQLQRLPSILRVFKRKDQPSESQ
jgi:hypothetical protein